MIPKALFLIMVGLFVSGTVFGADTYQIDPVHSSVGFSIRHMVISNVKGNFTDFAGTLIYDKNDLPQSSIDVTIKASSINTDNLDRDKHLRSADFFEVDKFPEITFHSHHIEKKGDGYIAVGKLTMHGVAKEITLPFTISGEIKDPMGSIRIGAEAMMTLNRQDYGISWNKALDNGGVLIGNDVNIDLNIEGIKI